MATLRYLRKWRCERGAELVEFALVLPLLLLIVMGIIDFGFAFQRYEIVTNAAREGARVAVLPGYSATDVQTRVTQYLTLSGLTGAPSIPAPVQAAVNIGGVCITTMSVTVNYPHTFSFMGAIASTFFGGTFGTTTLTSTATMRYEGAALTCP